MKTIRNFIAAAGIDVKPYATPVVEVLYKVATEEIERGYNGLAKGDIDFANGIATQAGIDVKPYATLLSKLK